MSHSNARSLSQALQQTAPSSREFRILLASPRYLCNSTEASFTLVDEHERFMRLTMSTGNLRITCSCGSHVVLDTKP